MQRKFVVSVLAAMALAGCTTDVQVESAPALNVYSSYADRVPGRWLLIVDSDNLSTEVHPSSYACSAYTYPMDLASPFVASARTTFQNVADVEAGGQNANVAALASNGYAGVIRIRTDEMRVKLRAEQGFWEGTYTATVEVDAGLTVDGKAGRLLGTQATGEGSADGDAGVVCDDGGPVLAEAAQKAIKNVLNQLAERFTNAPRLRPKD